MRLADQIIAAGRDKRHPLHEDHAALGGILKHSHLFHIDDEAGMASGAVGASDIRRLLAARHIERLPFGSCFFEWKGTSGRFFGNHAPPDNDRFLPSRTGIFVHTDESLQRGTMTLAWTIPMQGHETLQVSPLIATFDWRDKPEPVPCMVRAQRMALGAGELHPRETKFMALLTPQEQLVELRRWGMLPNPLTPRTHAHLNDLDRRDPAGTQRRWDLAAQDWEGEGTFLQAFLICLNSRNLLRVEPAGDLSRLNKSRRRLGRPELLSFATVKLSLSQAMRRKAALAAGEGDVRAHLVRGHFKLRKTGAFWWSPFVRGDANRGVVARRGYEVAA